MAEKTIEAIEARAEEVADDLTGTCRNLSDFATEDEVSNKAFMAALEAHVFECEVCNWWCGVDEMSDNPDQEVCTDCENAG